MATVSEGSGSGPDGAPGRRPVPRAGKNGAERAGSGQAAIGPQTLISAGALRVARQGPAPLIADLASFSVVSEPIHRQW